MSLISSVSYRKVNNTKSMCIGTVPVVGLYIKGIGPYMQIASLDGWNSWHSLYNVLSGKKKQLIWCFFTICLLLSFTLARKYILKKPNHVI